MSNIYIFKAGGVLELKGKRMIHGKEKAKIISRKVCAKLKRAVPI
jgi:hypothetical protein